MDEAGLTLHSREFAAPGQVSVYGRFECHRDHGEVEVALRSPYFCTVMTG